MPLKPLVSCHQPPPLNRADGEKQAVEGVFGLWQRRRHRDSVIKRHRQNFNIEPFKQRRDLINRHCQIELALFKLDRDFPKAHDADIVPPWIINNVAQPGGERRRCFVNQRDDDVGVEDQGFFQPSLGILISSGQGE
jgi:hypothetical protein